MTMLMRKANRNQVMLLGMFFLALGSMSLRFLPRVMREDSADAVTGLLYGLAIGCLVVSLVMARRRPPDNGPTR